MLPRLRLRAIIERSRMLKEAERASKNQVENKARANYQMQHEKVKPGVWFFCQ
jgi:hypothetical protein